MQGILGVLSIAHLERLGFPREGLGRSEVVLLGEGGGGLGA